MMEHDIAWWVLIMIHVISIIFVLCAPFIKKNKFESKWDKISFGLLLFGWGIMTIGSLCMEYYLDINNTLGTILLFGGFAILMISEIGTCIVTKKITPAMDTVIGKAIIGGIIIILVYVFL